jgi:hypothetical protein
MARPKAARPKQSDMQRTLGVGALNRIDPDEDFSDVDGDPRNDFALVNEDPDRNYTWVRNHPDDIGEYKGGIVGHRIEYRAKDGVDLRMSGEQSADEAIQKRGHVLMSCDRALWQKRNRYQLNETRKHNEMMFKRRQRDLDLRRPGALEEEAMEMRG